MKTVTKTLFALTLGLGVHGAAFAQATEATKPATPPAGVNTTAAKTKVPAPAQHADKPAATSVNVVPAVQHADKPAAVRSTTAPAVTPNAGTKHEHAAQPSLVMKDSKLAQTEVPDAKKIEGTSDAKKLKAKTKSEKRALNHKHMAPHSVSNTNVQPSQPLHAPAPNTIAPAAPIDKAVK